MYWQKYMGFGISLLGVLVTLLTQTGAFVAQERVALVEALLS